MTVPACDGWTACHRWVARCGGAVIGVRGMVDGWDGPVWPQDDELLPEQTSDDTDHGWNERQPEDDLERFLRERPPHHGD